MASGNSKSQMKYLLLFTAYMYSCIATDIVCPDGVTCFGSQTCCKLSNGHFACCPHRNAVCCANSTRCCRYGHYCTSHGCVRLEIENPSVLFLNSGQDEKSTVCSNIPFKCPSQYTCCHGKDQSYGCCPFANAVCCIDNEHCCPSGTRCNLLTNMCERNVYDTLIPIIKNIRNEQFVSPKRVVPLPALTTDEGDESINVMHRCSHSQYFCSGAGPCCKSPTGVFRCCNFASGTCCYDGLYCCPQGTKCVENFQNDYCAIGNTTIFAAKSYMAKSFDLGNSKDAIP